MRLSIDVVANSAKLLLTAALIVIAVGAFVGALVFGGQGWRLLSVQTGSMVPTFNPGDAVLMHHVNRHNLLVGEVVSYQSPRDARVTITHRLVDINNKTGWLTTQGDALVSPDPSFPPRLLKGQVVAVAPWFGRIVDLLRRPLSLVLLVYLPAGALITIQTRHLASYFAKPTYTLYGWPG